MSEHENSFTRYMANAAESIKFERELFVQEIQQLEVRNAELTKRNAELEDLRRWRDARKELPPRLKLSDTIGGNNTNNPDAESIYSISVEVCTNRNYIFDAHYSYGDEIARVGWCLGPYAQIHNKGQVVYWRPLDLPEIKEE